MLPHYIFSFLRHSVQKKSAKTICRYSLTANKELLGSDLVRFILYFFDHQLSTVCGLRSFLLHALASRKAGGVKTYRWERTVFQRNQRLDTISLKYYPQIRRTDSSYRKPLLCDWGKFPTYWKHTKANLFRLSPSIIKSYFPTWYLWSSINCWVAETTNYVLRKRSKLTKFAFFTSSFTWSACLAKKYWAW